MSRDENCLRRARQWELAKEALIFIYALRHKEAYSAENYTPSQGK